MGWVYGEHKDEQRKTHPCIVPYDELPAAQRAKDALFLANVRALQGMLEEQDAPAVPEEQDAPGLQDSVDKFIVALGYDAVELTDEMIEQAIVLSNTESLEDAAKLATVCGFQTDVDDEDLPQALAEFLG